MGNFKLKLQPTDLICCWFSRNATCSICIQVLCTDQKNNALQLPAFTRLCNVAYEQCATTESHIDSYSNSHSHSDNDNNTNSHVNYLPIVTVGYTVTFYLPFIDNSPTHSPLRLLIRDFRVTPSACSL